MRRESRGAAAGADRKKGRVISLPHLPLSLIMKGDMARGRGSSQKETALCRNCHAPPPILTCTGPFVVCRTCKLASPGCHLKAGRYAPVGENERPPVTKRMGSDGQAFSQPARHFQARHSPISKHHPPTTHTHTHTHLFSPPPSIPSPARTYNVKIYS